MGFLGKISKTVSWLGDTVGKGVTHLSRVVSKVGPSIGKGLERFGDVVAVVGDVAALLTPIVPELAVISEAATAIKDTSQALGKGLETGDIIGNLKEGVKQLAIDEIKGLVPGGSELGALSDLTKRAQSLVSGIRSSLADGGGDGQAGMMTSPNSNALMGSVSNYMPVTKKTKLSSFEM